MSFNNSRAVEKELEMTIFNNESDVRKLHNLAKCSVDNFHFVNTYQKLFKQVLNRVVEQASLGYDDSHGGHSFKRFTRLLVAQTLAKNIQHAGQIGARQNLRAFMDG